MIISPEEIPDRSTVPPRYPAFATTGFDGFAVIDLETTGLSARTGRILELAVVHVDPMGGETGRWETLLNPGGELGAGRNKGIRASDVLGAPSFVDIVVQLVGLLDGRVAVAHNAPFDSRFLYAEFERAGVGLWNKPSFLGTMDLARHFLPGTGRSLSDCCAAYDIPHGVAHRALDDAVATSRLLGAFLAEARRNPRTARPFTGLSGGRWPATISQGRPIPWKPRPAIPAVSTVGAFLGGLAERMPPSPLSEDAANEYLALLDRALLDRHLAVAETDALRACAGRIGLSRGEAVSLHEDYFFALTRVAWEDGILSEKEIDELLIVAELLEISTLVVERALDPQRAARILFERRPHPASVNGFSLRPGDVVVLTGETRRPRPVWEAELAAAGLATASAVTMATQLVVAADPDAVSGRVRKARQYGIPVVAEQALPRLLDAMAR